MTAHGVRIHTEQLGKTYQPPGSPAVKALDEVNIRADRGALIAVRGRSGSGKSTLLHLLGAMDRPDHGRILVDGEDLWAQNDRAREDYRSHVGFVFQRFHLLSALTAWENVAVPVMPRRTGYSKRARATELLDRVGLADRADAVPAELSGGEQQRVAIARALIVDPRLVLADEPTGNLDSTTGTEVLDLMLDVVGDHGSTLLVATHDAAVAARCHRTIHLQDGRTVNDDQLAPLI